MIGQIRGFWVSFQNILKRTLWSGKDRSPVEEETNMTNQSAPEGTQDTSNQPTRRDLILQPLGIQAATLDTELRLHRNGIIYSALELLNADIRNPDLTGSEATQDDYILRANMHALALARAGYDGLSRKLYKRIGDIVEEFRGNDPTASEWRHLGMIYLNLGIVQAKEGDFDRAVPNFLRTREEDQRTYGQEGPLIAEFYESEVRGPTLDNIYQVCHNAYDAAMPTPLNGNLLREFSLFLDELEYALFATVKSLITNSEENGRTPNFYSQLQLFNGLGNLCALYEAMIKRICEQNTDANVQGRYSNRPARFTLKAALDVLYDDPREGSWWPRVNTPSWRENTSYDQSQPGVEDFDTKLVNHLNNTPINEDDLRVITILVTALVRNFIGHERDLSSAITQGGFDDCFQSILLAFILAYEKAHRQGQI